MEKVYEYAAAVLAEVKRAIAGKDACITKAFATILAGGHILIEDVPGVGKTTLAIAFSRVMGLLDHRVQFTPDEEVGAGANLFDLAIFQADYAYTVDGDYEGEVAYENFNAASAIFHIKGVNVHPGEAKDIMVNAALVGCEIVSRLPEAETPAHTSGREGFYHLTDMSGDVAAATLSFIIRDHDKTTFEKRLQNLRDVAQSMNQKYGSETVTLDIEHSYENMLSVIEDKMEIVDLAKQAIASEGLTPLSRPIRGGTDGARLSFMGLPCPNLGTGGYGFHGPYEHISVEGMQTAVRILKNIATHPIRK